LNAEHSKFKKIAFITSVMLLVFVLLFLLMPHQRRLELPQSILQLRLTEEIRGTQAQEIIDAMHQKSVTPDENVIGTYFSTEGSAKLYVSVYASPKKAEEQYGKMIDLIRTGSVIFSHIRELEVQGEKIYLCLGLGQAHYFFLLKKELYWWAVDPQVAQSSMQELIRLVKKENIRN
jgi:hypothetical protein